jgi:hypothetical protein
MVAGSWVHGRLQYSTGDRRAQAHDAEAAKGRGRTPRCREDHRFVCAGLPRRSLCWLYVGWVLWLLARARTSASSPVCPSCPPPAPYSLPSRRLPSVSCALQLAPGARTALAAAGRSMTPASSRQRSSTTSCAARRAPQSTAISLVCAHACTRVCVPEHAYLPA